MCKLHLHKYEIVKRISGGDYPKYIEKCERCDKTVIATYNALGNPFVINRSDLTSRIMCIATKNGLINTWIEVEMKYLHGYEIFMILIIICLTIIIIVAMLTGNIDNIAKLIE
ncbi:hypothetical protein ACI1S3_05950 [Lactococcus garvieae]|uniref:hypothetical protein n=1 Tax=Lactococcus garvieae TaxID=1363 RepID=UPI0038548D06